MTNTFCCLPWNHLATHPHGGVTLCCVSDHRNSMNRSRNNTERGVYYTDLNKDSLDTIMNSDYFKQVRIEMLNGQKPEACLRCYQEESHGVRSKRIEETSKFNFNIEDARKITKADGEIPLDFEFVELRLGNLCNVKCRTCNPASSTSWITEYKKVYSLIPQITNYDYKIDSGWTESESFWNDLLEHSSNIKILYINGGEPTLVEKHWSYLERLIERGLNHQIVLWYNINMTNLPEKLIELWKKFKAVQISCSIDDLGERNDYIRTGTKWNDVIKNLDRLQSEPSINVSICQTISWLNIYYLPEFHDYMSKRGLHVHMNFVYDPVFLSSVHLSDKNKEAILLRCKDLPGHKLTQLNAHLSNTSDNIKYLGGIEYNKLLDEFRNTKFEQTFSEWAAILNGP